MKNGGKQDCPNLKYFLLYKNNLYSSLNQQYVRRQKHQLQNLDQLNNMRKATITKFLLFLPTTREITTCLNQPNSFSLFYNNRKTYKNWSSLMIYFTADVNLQIWGIFLPSQIHFKPCKTNCIYMRGSTMQDMSFSSNRPIYNVQEQYAF